MSYDSNKIRKGIFKLTETKKDSEFVEGATAFCDMLEEHEEPLPKDCLSYVSTRLSTACANDPPVFFAFFANDAHACSSQLAAQAYRRGTEVLRRQFHPKETGQAGPAGGARFPPGALRCFDGEDSPP